MKQTHRQHNRGCRGDNVPPTFGTRRCRGAVQHKWSLLLQQTVFIQYCTRDWISTPPTLVDTCKLMISGKTAWVVFPRSTPNWTAALFKSTETNVHICHLHRTFLEVCKQINAIINTQHYFKTYPARCQWPKIRPGAIQSMAYCC